jgi:hypothetical protein
LKYQLWLTDPNFAKNLFGRRLIRAYTSSIISNTRFEDDGSNVTSESVNNTFDKYFSYFDVKNVPLHTTPHAVWFSFDSEST